MQLIGKTKLVGPINEVLRGGSGPVLSTEALAGKLCFAQTAAMGRSGRVALKPLKRFTTGEAAKTPDIGFGPFALVARDTGASGPTKNKGGGPGTPGQN